MYIYINLDRHNIAGEHGSAFARDGMSASNIIDTREHKHAVGVGVCVCVYICVSVRTHAVYRGLLRDWIKKTTISCKL